MHKHTHPKSTVNFRINTSKLSDHFQSRELAQWSSACPGSYYCFPFFNPIFLITPFITPDVLLPFPSDKLPALWDEASIVNTSYQMANLFEFGCLIPESRYFALIYGTHLVCPPGITKKRVY